MSLLNRQAQGDCIQTQLKRLGLKPFRTEVTGLSVVNCVKDDSIPIVCLCWIGLHQGKKLHSLHQCVPAYAKQTLAVGQRSPCQGTLSFLQVLSHARVLECGTCQIQILFRWHFLHACQQT